MNTDGRTQSQPLLLFFLFLFFLLLGFLRDYCFSVGKKSLTRDWGCKLAFG